MNRILTWFLISLLLALSGPVQALSMGSARGFEKSLYGRSAPIHHKYAYCGGDPINFSDPMGLDRIKYLSGKYSGTWGGGVQFNEKFVNQNIRPGYESAGHTFSLSQGVDRFGVLNSMLDNDVVYISTHGKVNDGSGVAGLDLGPSFETDKLRSDDRDIPGSGNFARSPFRAKIVVAGACELGKTDAFANSLGITADSSAAFVGWDYSVDAGYSDKILQVFFNHLLDGRTVGEAADMIGDSSLRVYGSRDARLGR